MTNNELDTMRNKSKKKASVNQTIEEFKELGLEGVVLIGVDSKGNATVKTSVTTIGEKGFMVSFLNAVCAKWFKEVGVE